MAIDFVQPAAHLPDLQSDNDHSDLAIAEAALRRVHEAGREFLQALPSEQRTATALAEALDLDRTTCQRLCFVCNRPFGGLESVGRYPGVRAMSAIVQAAAPLHKAANQRNELALAAQAFDRVVREVSGSVANLERLARRAQTQLVDILPLASEDPNTGSSRENLTRAATGVTGRCSDAWVASYYIRQHRSEEGALEVWRVAGLHRLVSRTPAAPLVFQNFGGPQTAMPDLAAASFLNEFCSSLEPIATTRSEANSLTETIEFDQQHDHIDVFCRYPVATEPSTAPLHGIEEVWALINLPAHAMVFDVHLDRDLARRCFASVDVHLWQTNMTTSQGQRWATRLPDRCELRTITHPASLATGHYPRMQELTQRLFDLAQADPSNTVGYRCEVEHPLWRCGYRVALDFGEDGAEQSPSSSAEDR